MSSPTKKLNRSVIFWLCSGLLFGVGFHDDLLRMEQIWRTSAEYEYGFLIPLAVAWMVWRKRDALQHAPPAGSWWGVLILIIALAASTLGNMLLSRTMILYGFMLALFGTAWASMGWCRFKHIAMPLVFLLFMVPLPWFIYDWLSLSLQFISSEWGVAFIRACDVDVYLNGNVIDLGEHKLEVAEACNGLRYLFPLTVISSLAAYLFPAPLWKRAIILLSSIPIAVVMNSLRIGVTGVLVDRWGIEMAEGLFHDLEGWVIYGISIGLLLLEIRILGGFVLAQDLTSRKSGSLTLSHSGRRKAQPQALVTLTLLSVFAVYMHTAHYEKQQSGIHATVSKHLERTRFAFFPEEVGDWQGVLRQLPDRTLRSLNPEDYLLMDFHNSSGDIVNLHMAYYVDKTSGSWIHSPQYCLPAHGSKQLLMEQVSLKLGDGRSLTLNRLESLEGTEKVIAYFWFRLQGLDTPVDSSTDFLTRVRYLRDQYSQKRTDGALIRIMGAVAPAEAVAAADSRILGFIKNIYPLIEVHIPRKPHGR
ncbi:VPLPA-CTERM-specific exosortase XrtD [Magnetofaba australis]|uniref:Putative eight transmembrane protein EpsH n=1 Tax=Magnetofaba australis IT-1 TaxID=1434232 RepID=A0A1Y2K750_9PROT|nr:VPLPA-CTERM-specific exosortase XrtD [Magnetofaba australis]OSM04182.1 putative eight transmembrane protein EpsH [Magnetofaba australis IT-1]